MAPGRFLASLLMLLFAGVAVANPSIGQSEDTCVYSFQVPRQDSHAACSDSVSLDQQLLKTMVLSLQQQVTQLQDQLRNSHGASANTAKRNIRQCSWTGIDDGRENGQIKTCVFRKHADDTVLRVVWNGDLRLLTGDGSVCRRWFFTINGVECQSPAHIDAQIHEQVVGNLHRPAYLEGLCRGVTAGDLHVTFNVGDCLNMGGHQPGDSYTGWMYTCRIIVEEMDVQEPELIM